MHPTPFYVATMFSFVAAATAAVLQGRITNGIAVKQNELPFVGEIQLDVGNACTGFLIGPQTMMTAGHCVLHKGPDIYALLHNVARGQGHRVEVVKSVKYPDDVERGADSDIGLFFLAEKVAGPYAKIGGPYPEPSSKITAAGFGYIDGRGTTLPKGLNKVELKVAGVEDCKRHYMTFNSTAQFCTPVAQGRAICSGDSGGPLYVDVDGEPRVLGIASLSTSATCDRKGSRNYHIYITPFIPWVNKELRSSRLSR